MRKPCFETCVTSSRKAPIIAPVYIKAHKTTPMKIPKRLEPLVEDAARRLRQQESVRIE